MHCFAQLHSTKQRYYRATRTRDINSLTKSATVVDLDFGHYKNETFVVIQYYVSFTRRSVGQHPFHRLVPELQHPAAGGGGQAAVRGRQRSSVRTQHLQHLHTCKPHGECMPQFTTSSPLLTKKRKTRFHKFSPITQVLKEDKLIIAISRLSKSYCVPPILWILD